MSVDRVGVVVEPIPTTVDDLIQVCP